MIKDLYDTISSYNTRSLEKNKSEGGVIEKERESKKNLDNEGGGEDIILKRSVFLNF